MRSLLHFFFFSILFFLFLLTFFFPSIQQKSSCRQKYRDKHEEIPHHYPF